MTIGLGIVLIVLGLIFARDALLFPASADENLHMAPSTLYKVYYPARKAAAVRTSAGTTSGTPALCLRLRLEQASPS